MRCSGWSSLAISVSSALVLAGTASAHLVATPAFLPSGSSESIALAVPNERAEPVTGFSVTAPAELEIEHAHDVGGWDEQVGGLTASWRGGSLAPDDEVSFGITLGADTEAGVVQLEAVQSYDSGAVVRWPVAITVTPATESPSRNLALPGVLALIGLLTIVAIAMVAWRRRTSSTLQEK